MLTWNLHGSARPDLDAVAEQLRVMAPDVAAVQEVQHGQAIAIAQALGWASAHWSFKHFPVVKAPEGLAVLSPHPLEEVRTVVLSRCISPWSHRRRIAQLVRLRLAERIVPLANTHLASGDARARLQQARRLLAVLQPGTVVVGDLNDWPGSDCSAFSRPQACGIPGGHYIRTPPKPTGRPTGGRVTTMNARRGASTTSLHHKAITFSPPRCRPRLTATWAHTGASPTTFPSPPGSSSPPTASFCRRRRTV